MALKIKCYKDARGEFRWTALDGNNKVIADGSEGYSTERNLVLALKNTLAEFREPVKFVGFQIPLQAKRTPEL
jgi:uncharacterized protein YegP (UPF0339 family)